MNSLTLSDHHNFDYRLLSDLSVWVMIAVVVEFLFWIFTWWYEYPANSVPFASMHCEKCIALVFAHWFSWPSFEFNFSLMLLSLVVIQPALFSFSVNLARPFCVYAFRRFAFSWIDVFESIHWSLVVIFCCYFGSITYFYVLFDYCDFAPELCGCEFLAPALVLMFSWFGVFPCYSTDVIPPSNIYFSQAFAFFCDVSFALLSYATSMS